MVVVTFALPFALGAPRRGGTRPRGCGDSGLGGEEDSGGGRLGGLHVGLLEEQKKPSLEERGEGGLCLDGGGHDAEVVVESL